MALSSSKLAADILAHLRYVLGLPSKYLQLPTSCVWYPHAYLMHVLSNVMPHFRRGTALSLGASAPMPSCRALSHHH